jgi:hypothetical protein
MTPSLRLALRRSLSLGILPIALVASLATDAAAHPPPRPIPAEAFAACAASDLEEGDACYLGAGAARHLGTCVEDADERLYCDARQRPSGS